MFRVVGRTVVLGTVGVGAGAAFALPNLPKVKAQEKSSEETGKIRPSQLPIYAKVEDLYDVIYEGKEKSELEKTMASLRSQLCGMYQSTGEVRDRVDHILATGKAHTMGQVQWLREEENLTGRVAVVAACSTVGLLLGRRAVLRRGAFALDAGAGATAALYPTETLFYTDEILNNAPVYYTVAYNFVFGVKPQNGNGAPAVDAGLYSTNLVEEKVVEPVVEEVEPVVDEVKPVKTEQAELAEDIKEPEPIGEDHGQSSEEDSDMYTTR